MTTVLAFVLTLGVLIVIHEWGHYRAARACGVKVLRFSVGFGRVLWRRQRTPESTEFVLCALPLGGYVRMLDEREQPVAPHEQHLAFNRKPLAQRAAIVAAGPLANLLLAVLLYAVSMWVGVQEPKALLASPPAGSLAERAGLRAGDWVSEWSVDEAQWEPVLSMNDLRWRVTRAALDGDDLYLRAADREGHGAHVRRLELSSLRVSDVDASLMKRIGIGSTFSEAVIGQPRPGGPADLAGLRDGDRVLRIDGTPVPDAAFLRERIVASVRNGQATPLEFEVERGGQVMVVEVLPRVATDVEPAVGRIDAYVGMPPQQVVVRRGPWDSLQYGLNQTWEVSALTLQMIGRMVTGEASLKNLSGPLTIADYAGQSVQQGLAYYLGFLALVSVSLGVLNLLPLPMLDGGHLMYYLFEGVTGRPVSEAWLQWLQRAGAVVLLLLMSLALSNDVARLLGLH